MEEVFEWSFYVTRYNLFFCLLFRLGKDFIWTWEESFFSLSYTKDRQKVENFTQKYDTLQKHEIIYVIWTLYVLLKLNKNNMLALIYTEVLCIPEKALLFVSLQMNHIGAKGAVPHALVHLL